MEALGINIGYLLLQIMCIGVIPVLLAGGFAIYLIRKNRSDSE